MGSMARGIMKFLLTEYEEEDKKKNVAVGFVLSNLITDSGTNLISVLFIIQGYLFVKIPVVC